MDVIEIADRLENIIRRNRRTIKAVQKNAGVGNNYLWRLRKGAIGAPTMETLRAVVEAAGGTWDEMRPLFEATAIRPELEAAIDAGVADAMTDEPPDPARVRANAVINKLSHRPLDLEHWLSYGEGMAAGSGGTS